MISWRQFTQLHYFGNRLLHLAHLARLDKGLSQTKKHKRDLLGEKKHKNTKANQKLCSYAKKERVTCGLDWPSYLLPVASVAAGASSRRIGSFGTYEAMLIDVKDKRRTSLLHPDTVPKSTVFGQLQKRPLFSLAAGPCHPTDTLPGCNVVKMIQ